LNRRGIRPVKITVIVIIGTTSIWNYIPLRIMMHNPYSPYRIRVAIMIVPVVIISVVSLSLGSRTNE
jgi:hypothetical protein